MGATLLACQLILVLCFTIFTLNKYAQLKNQRLIVLIITFFGWFFSFLIIIVLPLDVAITFYKKCLSENVGAIENVFDEQSAARTLRTTTAYQSGEDYNNPFQANTSSLCEEPKGFVEDGFLFGLWRVVYWGSQFLTWILLPMMQSYAKAGEFTVKGRINYAFYSNALYYGIYFALLFFLLFYVVSKGVSLDFASLKVLVVSASNTWGIFLLVILLGYGLIEVPREFWRMGIRGYRLQRAYFDIDKLSSEKSEADEAIAEAYMETKNALNLLKDTRSEAREKIKQIAAKFPYDFVKQTNNASVYGHLAYESRSRTSSLQMDVDMVSQDAYLVKLHRKVIGAAQTFQRCQVQWRSLLDLAFYLEDVNVAESMGKLPSRWLSSDRNATKDARNKRPALPLLEDFRFLWHTLLQRHVFQCLAIFFSAMTILILWSECTFFIVHPQLSLAARLLHGAARGYHYKFIQIGAVAMILYLCICAYYTIFRLRIYRYYRLDPHGMTDENSLIFSAMLICRLTAPLCLNFLGMIHLDSTITKIRSTKIETQFTRLMGHLEIIPWLAEGINIYLPIAIVLLCLATWFRLGTRFLHNLGIDQFLEEDEMTIEMVRSGKALVALERNRVNRIVSREERNQGWRTAERQEGKLATNSPVGGENSDNLPILGQSESITGGLIVQGIGGSFRQEHRPNTADDEVLIDMTPQRFFDDL